jgi:site-specific DNA-methyltransferase (adenine-specific)
MSRYTLHVGDCRDVLRDYPADHFDSIVSDPPYGLSFMGKGWDEGVPGEEFWQEALRVAKPGAHLLAFGGTRTFHRLTVAIEDAGWEIRDCMMWLYGSGFPKSHDVSKAIDKDAGIWRGRAGAVVSGNPAMGGPNYERTDKGEPATPEASAWQGWGTALKPAWEPVIVARKPLSGTVADNVLRYGTGALNIDGCRVGGNEGRWPANVMHDGSAEVVDGFPDAEARFFYCAKASRTDRDDGNTHPTVKPTDLMRYLCRLVTPPGGVVLDPFMGSGSTGKAALIEGLRFVGIDLDPAHVAIAQARCQEAALETPLSQLTLFQPSNP